MRRITNAVTNADMARFCSTPCKPPTHFAQNKLATGQGVRLLFCCLTAGALSGCAGLGTAKPDGSLVRHYLGYVKVSIPQAAAHKAFYTSDVSVLGVRLGNGIGVGYSRDRQVVVPLDCRIAVLVANQAQLDDAVARLPTLFSKGDICAVVSPTLENNPTGEKP